MTAWDKLIHSLEQAKCADLTREEWVEIRERFQLQIETWKGAEEHSLAIMGVFETVLHDVEFELDLDSTRQKATL